jgi:hypothetical protein
LYLLQVPGTQELGTEDLALDIVDDVSAWGRPFELEMVVEGIFPD